jgi:NAD(P)-dependent dehydrogenase (short-subunit alcohol dehydrogenase family)
MLARKRDLINQLEKELPGSHAFICDVSDLDALTKVCQTVADEMGTPDVVIHNAARGTFVTMLEAEPENLEANFRVNVTALLYIARSFAPAMIKRGSGCIIATGNTSATRGRANFVYFAPTKAAQRILAQSLARDLGPKGIHVARLRLPRILATVMIEELAGVGRSQVVDQASQLRHALSRGLGPMGPAHVGLHPARIDDNTSDAARGEIDCEATHHHVHSRLRAAIGKGAPRSIVGNRAHAAGKGDDELALASCYVIGKCL